MRIIVIIEEKNLSNQATKTHTKEKVQQYSGNPNLDDIISASTGIRMSRKRCMETIDEIESVCHAELDADKILKIKDKQKNKKESQQQVSCLMLTFFADKYMLFDYSMKS